jgi:hypothetical protein
MFPTDPDMKYGNHYGVGGFVCQRPAQRRESMLSCAVVLVRLPARGFLVQRCAQAANHVLRNRIGAMLVGFLANGYNAPVEVTRLLPTD